MKKLILFLLLIPQLVISQNSWFNLEVQFDQFGPSESFMLISQAGDTLVNHTPTIPNEFYQTYVPCDSVNIVNSVVPELVVPFLNIHFAPLPPTFET